MARRPPCQPASRPVARAAGAGGAAARTMSPAELPVSMSSIAFEPLSISILMCGVTSAHFPKAATYPDDRQLCANLAARHTSPSSFISDAKASFCEHPVYAATLSTMAKSKDCAFGGRRRA